MARTILRKAAPNQEITRRTPQVGKAMDAIGGAIGIASLLSASDGEIEGTKDGTLQLVGEALLALLNKAFDALAVD